MRSCERLSTMDSNKDEGERCIRLAERFLEIGELDQALKYLNKAERLYPSQRAKDLLAGIEKPESAFSHFENTDQSDCKTTTVPPAHEPIYTDEQLTAVRKIRDCKNYYELLGLDKNCSDDDLKKSYKKLALKFHPDKNHAPGATEAFKAISNAFAVLSNSEKRRHYDRCDTKKGSKPEFCSPRRRSADNDFYEFTNGFEGEVSADELFQMFFGAAFRPGTRTSRPARQPRQPRTTHSSNTTANVTAQPPPVSRPPPTEHQFPRSSGFLLQVSPIMFLVILSLLSTMLVRDSVFSLHQDTKYYSERSTQRFSIAYFVGSDFNEKYPADGAAFRRVEAQVEDEHVSNLQYHCYRERSQRENAMWRARIYHNDALFKQAKELRSPSCEALDALKLLATGGNSIAT